MIRKPPARILETVAPLQLWKQAEKQATRSTLKNFKTGAIIFDANSKKIITRGCSHASDRLRDYIHAEHHALLQHKTYRNQNHDCLVVTISPTGSWAGSSRPCGLCARLLHAKGIMRVFYPYRDKSGIWSVKAESTESLFERSSKISLRRYAKDMQLA